MKEDMTEELEKELKTEDMEKSEDKSDEMSEDKDEMAKMKEDMDDLQKSFDTLSKAVSALGYTFEDGALEKSAAEEYIEVEGERIAKSAVPAVILKSLEAKDAELRKAAEDKAQEDLRKRAGDIFPNLKGTLDERGALLKSLEGLSEDIRKSVMESLKAADHAMAKAYGEEGKSPAADDKSDPEAALNKMVDEFAKANELSFYKAYAAIVKTAEGKALLKQIDKE